MKWLSIGLILFATLPATTTYELNSYGFGSGSTANSTTTNYALEGNTGEISGQIATTATYSAKPAFIQTQQANVPKIATFDNGSGTYYNKLHFVIDQQSNPSDALYALSIITDNFASDIRYIKHDLTVEPSLSVADYQSYTTWGGAGGASILGLLPNTTYYLRAKATQGKFTESGYGPAASVATVNPQLSFSLSTNTENLGSLLAGSVINAPSTINVTFATNAASGGDVYINGLNTGLHSVAANSTIPSTSNDLSSISHGFGAQVTTTGASSGTFSSVGPYAFVNSTTVGLTDTTIRRIMTASGPIVGGTGSVLLKAKSASTDLAATDYTETLTMLASASF
jgi:hypothetical protein